jgi:hypothetical protein
MGGYTGMCAVKAVHTSLPVTHLVGGVIARKV